MRPTPSWLLKLKNRPLTFAQTREDPWIDAAVIRKSNRPAKVAIVASGGCTATYLAGSLDLAELHLIDSNPAQLGLTRLKLHLLQTTRVEQREEILGHAPLSPTKRGRWLSRALRRLAIPTDFFGPLSEVAETGPDYAGRCESLFRALQDGLASSRKGLHELVSKSNPVVQAELARPQSRLGRKIDKVFARILSLQNLRQAFGMLATDNRVVPFHEHFSAQLRMALSTQPARHNPFLWQMLLGRYPTAESGAWFELPRQKRLPPITCAETSMENWLAAAEDGSFDTLHLSNIFDWGPSRIVRRTLSQALRVLRPGGRVVIRQLNSALELRKLGEGFTWENEFAAEWHARDRSFFYRDLLIGVKS